MRVLLSLLCISASLVASQQTWHVVGNNQDLATIIIGVSFVNETHGWIPADENGLGAVFLRSEDGGVHWKKCTHNGYVTLPMGIAMQGGFSDGSTYGVIGGIGFGRNFSAFESTHDGYTFDSPSPNPDFFGESQDSKRIFGADKSFALTGQYEDNKGRIYNGLAATFDGGATYQNFDVGFDDPLCRYGHYPSRNVWYVAAGDWPELDMWDNDAEARVISHKLRIHKRHGVQYRHNVLASEEGIAALSGAAASRALKQTYPYKAAIAKTTDGGKTWATVFNDTGNFYFNDIDCPTETVCFAVGESGDDSPNPGIRILHSGDGGATWDVQLYINDDTYSLVEVAMVSELEGWASGGILSAREFNGLFFHTSDGGETWVNQQKLDDEYAMAISFVQPATGPYIGWASALTKEGGSSILTYS